MNGMVWTDKRAGAFLRELLQVAIASADPKQVLASHLPAKPVGKCVVVGAGKAAASMALAVEAAWPDVPMGGVVVAPYGYGAVGERIHIREAGHPVPDANSEVAAREILAAVKSLNPEDLVLALISGGGSSVLSLPAPGITLEDKQATNRALLASGLDIRTMNAVRRRLSAIKGGRLAAAASPAKVLTLAISDIPGDDVAAIASGPTVADIYSDVDISEAITRLAGKIPQNVIQRLMAPAAPPDIPASDFRLIAKPAFALEAAAAIGRAAGLDVEILGDDLEGESRDLAVWMAGLALASHSGPKLFLSGGETTVTIADKRAGRGGRNTEFLLALCLALQGRRGVWALAADTDGLDGDNLGAAGAVLTPDTLDRGRDLGLDAEVSLAEHDSGSYFDALGYLLFTGPTRTNVNDFRAILIIPERFL
jgi:hydroxypyruvate reductase